MKGITCQGSTEIGGFPVKRGVLLRLGIQLQSVQLASCRKASGSLKQEFCLALCVCTCSISTHPTTTLDPVEQGNLGERDRPK